MTDDERQAVARMKCSLTTARQSRGFHGAMVVEAEDVGLLLCAAGRLDNAERGVVELGYLRSQLTLLAAAPEGSDPDNVLITLSRRQLGEPLPDDGLAVVSLSALLNILGSGV